MRTFPEIFRIVPKSKERCADGLTTDESFDLGSFGAQGASLHCNVARFSEPKALDA